MHDIGKLLFFRSIESDYLKTIRNAYDNNITIRDSEAEVLGVTHTVAGELIAEKWKTSVKYKNCIRHHYTGVVDGKVDNMVATVHLANIVARLFELGETGDNIVPEPNISIWQTLGLSDTIFSNLYSKIMNDYEESLALFILK